MKTKRSCLLALLALLTVTFASSARAETWNPQKTWVFIVGLVTWKDTESFDSFPGQNRKDTVLVDTFKKRGVPAEQIVYLQDAEATTSIVESRFAEFVKR